MFTSHPSPAHTHTQPRLPWDVTHKTNQYLLIPPPSQRHLCPGTEPDNRQTQPRTAPRKTPILDRDTHAQTLGDTNTQENTRQTQSCPLPTHSDVGLNRERGPPSPPAGWGHMDAGPSPKGQKNNHRAARPADRTDTQTRHSQTQSQAEATHRLQRPVRHRNLPKPRAAPIRQTEAQTPGLTQSCQSEGLAHANQLTHMEPRLGPTPSPPALTQPLKEISERPEGLRQQS